MIRLPTAISELIRKGGTVVVPTRQRAHAARLAYSASELNSGRRVWATPDILPIEAWLTREIERYAGSADASLPRLLSPAEEWLLWRQCAAQATSDLELVNRGTLADALRRASTVAADFGIDLSKVRDVPGTESALLCEVQRAVDERCRPLGAVSSASLVARLPCIGDHRPVIFRGFLTPSARLESLVAARRKHGYDAGHDGSEQTRDVGGSRPRTLIAADELEELERIAEWCRVQATKRPDARILVVLPGAPGARERLAALVRQAVDPRYSLEESQSASNALVVIEGGSPLARIPSVAHALASLGWLRGEAADFESLSGWLRAPYWNVPPGARARLDLWLREQGWLQLDLRKLLTVLNGAPSHLSTPARGLVHEMQTAAGLVEQRSGSPREWSERFRAALDTLGWPGNRVLSSGEQQTVVRFHELLDEFGQLAAAVGSIPLDTAIQWLTELATRSAFRPADDDPVVTISPMFADPVVRYDAIWVASLHAETFPQPVQPDPFLPLAAQLSAGVPAASAAGRLREAHSLITAWRAATEELVFSVPARSEDLELLPSPLLTHWLSESGGNPPTVWLPRRIHRDELLEAVDDDAGLPWPADRPLPGTRSLELQNQCPFRAYAELRLGSAELGDSQPGVPPDLRGQLLHVALQKVWQRLRDWHALVALSDAGLDGLVGQSVAEAAEMVLGAASDRSPAFVRECRRANRLIRTLCRLERERAPFRVEATEHEAILTLTPGSLERQARMRIRIDRLDVLDAGGRAILDYKSGRRIAADWYGERPSHPQLLAYLAAIGSDVHALATVNVTGREVRFEGIASSSNLIPKVKGVVGPDGKGGPDAWRIRQSEWLARIERLAGDFLSGESSVDPKPGACDFCHAISLCRISDQRGAMAEAETDDDDAA